MPEAFTIRDPRTGAIYKPKLVPDRGPAIYGRAEPVIDIPAISWHGPSTCLSRIVYDPKSGLMRLTFRKSGAQYAYQVPRDVAEGLINAPSKGRYFVYNIRLKYDV